MVAVPNPIIGQTEWGDELNARLNDLDLSITTGNNAVVAKATYALGFSVAVPTGGDDTAMLAAAFTGTRHVSLQAGAVYTVSGAPGSLPAFTGKISGNHATLKFAYVGAYSADGWIKNWSDVVITGLKLTAPNVEHLAMFDGTCRDLVFRDCTVFDSEALFCNPFTAGGLTVEHCLFTETGSRPATMTQTVTIPETGRFVFAHNVVNFKANGTAGAIVTSVSSDIVGQSEVWITDNTFFDANLTGYSVDAVIDIEPRGAVAHDLVEINGNTIYNSSIYLSGARCINAHNNTIRHTSVNTQSRMTAFILFNSNGTQPATGTVSISDNTIVQDNVAVATIARVVEVLIAVSELHMRNNKITVNGAATAPGSPYQISSTVGRLVIDGDRITGGGATYTAQPVVKLSAALPSQLEIIGGSRFVGTYSRLVELAGGSSGTIGLLRVADNDLSGLTLSAGSTFANWLLHGGSGTITDTIFDRNAGVPSDLAFRATMASAQAFTASVFTDVNYTVEGHDTGADYSGNTYTVPVTGSYLFAAGVAPDSAPASTTRILLALYVNGVFSTAIADQVGARQVVGSTTARLTKGDTVKVYMFPTVATTIDPSTTSSFFAGCLVAG